jgi:predicted lipase
MNNAPYAVSDAILWGELVQQAYDMYDNAKGSVTPPIPAMPGLPAGWILKAYLVVEDQVLFFKGNSSFGYIIQDATGSQYGIVIRGTENTLEWIQDVEACQTDFILGTANYGKVEQGFLGEYQNLSVYDAATRTSIGKLPLWLSTVPPAASIVVTGHSLGAAVAVIAGAQAAIQGNPTRVYSFASPQVGDSQFATAFNALQLAHYRIYNMHDLVPKVPSPSLGYYEVDTGVEIDSDTGKIKTDVVCCHSLRTYLSILGSIKYTLDTTCIAVPAPAPVVTAPSPAASP